MSAHSFTATETVLPDRGHPSNSCKTAIDGCPGVLSPAGDPRETAERQVGFACAAVADARTHE